MKKTQTSAAEKKASNIAAQYNKKPDGVALLSANIKEDQRKNGTMDKISLFQRKKIGEKTLALQLIAPKGGVEAAYAAAGFNTNKHALNYAQLARYWDLIESEVAATGRFIQFNEALARISFKLKGDNAPTEVAGMPAPGSIALNAKKSKKERTSLQDVKAQLTRLKSIGKFLTDHKMLEIVKKEVAEFNEMLK